MSSSKTTDSSLLSSSQETVETDGEENTSNSKSIVDRFIESHGKSQTVNAYLWTIVLLCKLLNFSSVLILSMNVYRSSSMQSNPM